jgi:hypothetical protein
MHLIVVRKIGKKIAASIFVSAYLICYLGGAHGEGARGVDEMNGGVL